jgi:hypothetical protein
MSTAEVDAFLESLEHTELAGIRSLRAAVVAADERIVEHIKWNAPSFGVGGDDDLITMRLAPRDAFQLVFHRGVAKRAGSVTLDDPEGLLVWRSADRAVADIRTSTRAGELEPAVSALVRAWIIAAG